MHDLKKLIQKYAVALHIEAETTDVPARQKEIYQNTNEETRSYLAQNPYLLPELQHKMMDTGSSFLLNKLARNINLLPEIQIKLFNTNVNYILEGLARNHHLLPELQIKLAQSQLPFVKGFLALNPNLVGEAWDILSNLDSLDTSSQEIRRILTKVHPNRPQLSKSKEISTETPKFEMSDEQFKKYYGISRQQAKEDQEYREKMQKLFSSQIMTKILAKYS